MKKNDTDGYYINPETAAIAQYPIIFHWFAREIGRQSHSCWPLTKTVLGGMLNSKKTAVASPLSSFLWGLVFTRPFPFRWWCTQFGCFAKRDLNKLMPQHYPPSLTLTVDHLFLIFWSYRYKKRLSSVFEPPLKKLYLVLIRCLYIYDIWYLALKHFFWVFRVCIGIKACIVLSYS